jgi:hypothetical protein
MVFRLGPTQFVGFQRLLKQFMSSEERDTFDRYPDKHLMFEPKPGSCAIMILRGRQPEKEASESAGLRG